MNIRKHRNDLANLGYPTQSAANNTSKPVEIGSNCQSRSRRYQDYVIKEGTLLGKFEEMYRESSEIPWHQDKTAYSLLGDFDLAVLRHFCELKKWETVADLGCGLGYFTARV